MDKTSELLHCNGSPKRENAAIDTAYAAIGTVKVVAFAAINRIRVKFIKKKSEISGFGLIILKTFPSENMQFRFTWYIPRIRSVSRDRGKSLALDLVTT